MKIPASFRRDRTPGPNALLFVFITVFLNMVGFGVIIPVMPDLIMLVSGEPLAQAARWGGLLSAAYAFMQFFCSPIVGALSDRFGRRPVILMSLFAYSMDFLLLALAPSIAILLLARVMAGAFAATFTTANAFIADISSPEKRAANFGLIGAAFGLGFTIGPAIGGYLGEAFGARAPFFFVAGLGLTNLIYGFIFLPETLAPENRRKFNWKRANALGNFVHFRQYPAILPIALSLLLYQIGHWTFPSVWAYYAQEQFNWDMREVGHSLMFVGICAAIMQGGLARIVIPRLGERFISIAALSTAVLVYPAYAFAQQGWMVYALIPFGALVGLSMPALQGIMSRTIPANAQGELQGAISSISGLAMIFGPWLMTQMFAAFSDPNASVSIGSLTILESGAPIYFPGAPFVLAGALALASMIPLFFAFGLIKRKHSAPPTDVGVTPLTDEL